MKENNALSRLEAEIIRVLKNVFDPEIPVNIYDLGLIYNLEVDDDYVAHILMTFTAPNCPIADQLVEEIRKKVTSTEGIKECDIKITFDPPWDKNMLSDEAKLELGFL